MTSLYSCASCLKASTSAKWKAGEATRISGRGKGEEKKVGG